MNSKAPKNEFGEGILLFHFASFFKFMHAKVSVTWHRNLCKTTQLRKAVFHLCIGKTRA